MDLPKAAYHLISLTIELGLVFAIALVAVRLVAREAGAGAHQHVLHHTVQLFEVASGPARVELRYCQSIPEALGASARHEPTENGNRYTFSTPTRRQGQ